MKSLTGSLLVASPDLSDPNFAKTVTLLIDHQDQGAMGLVLNRPTDLSLDELWTKISDQPCHSPAVIHQGGPCEGVLMTLHTQSEAGQLELLPGVYFSADMENVSWLVQHATGPVRYFIGYAGWGPGQLESELGIGSWLVVPGHKTHVFDRQAELWAMLTASIDPVAAMLMAVPKHRPIDPRMN